LFTLFVNNPGKRVQNDEQGFMPPRAEERPETSTKLLLVDGSRARAQALAEAIGAALPGGSEITVVASGREAVEALRAGRFDVLLMDLASLADLAPGAAAAIARLVKLAEGALTMALSDGGSVSAAVEVMRAGAHDCATRPIDGLTVAVRLAALSRRHGRLHIGGLETLLHDAGAGGDGGRRLEPRGERRSPVLPMWRQEQRIIEEAIASFSGNIALAAAALELSPSTIYRKRQLWAEAEDKRGAA
jgi:DNA-binding NtrC family response regulator